jgi:hypothetical protein
MIARTLRDKTRATTRHVMLHDPVAFGIAIGTAFLRIGRSENRDKRRLYRDRNVHRSRIIGDKQPTARHQFGQLFERGSAGGGLIQALAFLL